MISTRTTTHAERVYIVERHLAGHALAKIATEMSLNRYTVRHWWRTYRDKGWSGLKPKPLGRPQRGSAGTIKPMTRYVALRLKSENPGWGLDVLLLEMSRRPSLEGAKLPCRTSLYTYLRPYYNRLRNSYRRLPTRRPETIIPAVTAVHQRWQIDFKGHEHVASVGRVAALNVCDEYCSAPLGGTIYTKRIGDPKSGLTFRDVQSELRLLFTQWGMPDQLRMDRDALWVGSTRLEWPGTLLLWLVGLNIRPVINRPGHPTDNAQIERLNRTWDEHVRLGADGCSKEQIQQRTDQAWADRRERLPSRNPHCNGLPPLTALPELSIPRRSFSIYREESLFSMQRVHQYLSEWQWQRKVDKSGSISMADYNRSIGKSYAGMLVRVRFCTHSLSFIAYDMDNTTLNSFTLPVISDDYILG